MQRIKTLGKDTAPRGIPTTKLRGGITQEDMIRLEMRKKEFFLDYNNVDKYLDQLKAKKMGQTVEGPPVKTLSLMTTNNHLDDSFNPLSSRIIVDKKAEIDFVKSKKGNKMIAPKARFIECFQNKYYAQISKQQDEKVARE